MLKYVERSFWKKCFWRFLSVARRAPPISLQKSGQEVHNWLGSRDNGIWRRQSPPLIPQIYTYGSVLSMLNKRLWRLPHSVAAGVGTKFVLDIVSRSRDLSAVAQWYAGRPPAPQCSILLTPHLFLTLSFLARPLACAERMFATIMQTAIKLNVLQCSLRFRANHRGSFCCGRERANAV